MREPLHEYPGELGTIGRCELKILSGPVGVPTLRTRHWVKIGVLLQPFTPNTREPGSRSTRWKGGHPVRSWAATPDGVASSVVLLVAPEPLVLDRSALTHSCEHATDPRRLHGRRQQDVQSR